MKDNLVIDPLKYSQLIKPLDTRNLSSQDIQKLYIDESLTDLEYVILDYIGNTVDLKLGEVEISFQGLKRLTNIHQAKLTKAINRLVEKDMLKKGDAGYKLTDIGYVVFQRLLRNYNRQESILPKNVYSSVVEGEVQGPPLSENDYQLIAKKLVGKWFGRFRYTSKTQYENSFELGWVSVNGGISATLIIGPENDFTLTTSASIYDEATSELQLLMNHISNSIEEIIDAPLIYESYNVYENRKELKIELDNAILAYAR